MIMISDNVATNLLIKYLGREQYKGYNSTIGIKKYRTISG